MHRYLQNNILNDLQKKMVFITGPRQVGKTYLSKQIKEKFDLSVYLNFDDIDDADTIKKRAWPRNSRLIVFDEIHKMKQWKNYLKGTFDTSEAHQSMLITGSARLEAFRKSGDSLAGRYFHYRLNPISVHELKGTMPAYDALNTLNMFGGFPEPFLYGSQIEAQRWRQHYYTDLVREDILDFSRIHEIRSMRLLLEMLRKRVGSPLSYTSLAEDLQKSPNTILKYINILEDLYIIFTVRPFHKNIARAILKAPKVYFYDSGYVEGDDGTRLENTVAVCLLKHVQFLQDSQGEKISLHYIRTKEGKEIDFVISQNDTMTTGIEVKLSESDISPNLRYFQSRLSGVEWLQLVHNLKQGKEAEGVKVLPAGDWLADLSA